MPVQIGFQPFSPPQNKSVKSISRGTYTINPPWHTVQNRLTVGSTAVSSVTPQVNVPAYYTSSSGYYLFKLTHITQELLLTTADTSYTTIRSYGNNTLQ